MKKKIFVNLILILEVVVFAFYFVSTKYTGVLDQIVPFNYVILAGSWLHNFFDQVANLIKIKELFITLLGYNLHFIAIFIAFVVFNLAWIIVFYIVFGIIGAIGKYISTKKRRKLISEYKLTPTEEKKFAFENYKKKATRWVGGTLIIPIILLAIFIIARFDPTIIALGGLKVNTNVTFDIYSKFIAPVLNGVSNPVNINDLFILVYSNDLNIGYFNFVNTYLANFAWVEYVVLVVGTLVILFVWWLIFALIGLIFRRPRAKALSKKAIKAYKEKMEKTEYKLRKKYKDDAVAKGDEFLKIIEEDLTEDANEIAKIKEEKSKRHQKKIDARKKAYLEEIGYGVVDLGVSEETPKEKKEPLTEREIRYISDADIDIILDEEPVIEVVEEDDMEEVELANKEDDLFFEKYQDDDVELDEVVEGKVDPTDVMNYVQTKAEDKKEEIPVIEEVIEEELQIEEYEEVKEDIIEEPIQEEVEEVKEEAPKKKDPFAAYRNTVRKGHGAKKVPSLKELQAQQTPTKNESAPKKENKAPVAKKETKPTTSTKVEEKAPETPKKNDPFAAYRNKPKASTAAKKVPSKKELEQLEASKKQAKPKAEAPKKNDPFAAYRNKAREKGHGAKKV